MNFDTSGVSRNGDAESDTRGISAEAGISGTRGAKTESRISGTRGAKTESGISGTRGAKTEGANFDTRGINQNGKAESDTRGVTPMNESAGGKSYTGGITLMSESAGAKSYATGVTLPLSQLIPLVSPQSTPFFFSGRTPSGLNSHCGVRSAFSFSRSRFLFPCGGVV